MSVRAWLEPEPIRASGGIARTVTEVTGQPDADGVLAELPFAEAIGPLYRERLAAVTARWDGLTPEQRARVDPAARRAAHNVADRAFLDGRYAGVLAALVCLDALVEYAATGQAQRAAERSAS